MNISAQLGKYLASRIKELPNPMIASGYEVNAFMSIPVLDVRETVGKIKSSMSFGSDNVRVTS